MHITTSQKMFYILSLIEDIFDDFSDSSKIDYFEKQLILEIACRSYVSKQRINH